MAWTVLIPQDVDRELSQFPPRLLRDVYAALEAGQENPFDMGIDPLRKMRDAYKMRFGEYRVLLKLNTRRRVIEVFRARHRSKVYSGLPSSD